jgi:DNA-binding transcriptional MocR family regulator
MKTSRHHTLQDQTYETLRQWLTIGRFVPGERIKIRHVAAELGVGEMPVRSALQRLAAESALMLPSLRARLPWTYWHAARVRRGAREEGLLLGRAHEALTHADAAAELAPGEPPDGLPARAHLEGLVVGVEGQRAHGPTVPLWKMVWQCNRRRPHRAQPHDLFHHHVQ